MGKVFFISPKKMFKKFLSLQKSCYLCTRNQTNGLLKYNASIAQLVRAPDC